MRYAIVLAAVLFAHGMRAAESVFTITGVNDSTVYDWNLASIWSGSTVPNSPDAVVSLGEPEAKRLLLRIPASYSFAIDSIVSSPIDTYWRFNVGAATTNVVSRITARTLEGYCSVWPIGFMYSQNWKINGAMTGFDFTGGGSVDCAVLLSRNAAAFLRACRRRSRGDQAALPPGDASQDRRRQIDRRRIGRDGRGRIRRRRLSLHRR